MGINRNRNINSDNEPKSKNVDKKVHVDGRVTQVKFLNYITSTAPKVSNITKYDDNLYSFNSTFDKGDKVKGLEVKTNRLRFGRLFKVLKGDGKIIGYIIKHNNQKYNIQVRTLMKIPLQEHIHVLDYDSFVI